MAARTRQERFEFRTTAEFRDLIKKAAEASGNTLTEFAEASLAASARRVLADRRQFSLSEEALVAWEDINSRPARELDGIRRLVERPSPFEE